jgi:hypothetical protein
MRCRKTCFSFLVILLFTSAHRLPAPISELATPTASPESTARPKVKRTPKTKPSSDTSEKVTKRQTVSATPTNQIVSKRSAFDGTWVGTLNGLPFNGDVDYTLAVTASGTSVNERSATFGSLTWRAMCDGVTMRWKSGAGCAWVLAPNPDGKTALVTVNCPGFFGVGVYNSSSILRKTSP